MDAGYEAIRDMDASLPQRLPCCSFVAIWTLAAAGWIPRNRASIDAWAAIDASWWRWANLRGHPDIPAGDPNPWDALWACRARLAAGGINADWRGGWACTRDTPPPPLTAGSWHIVQRWRGIDEDTTGPENDAIIPGSRGHTYLVRALEDGRAEVHQSSTTLGYRVSRGTWSGLVGYTVGLIRVGFVRPK